jgi:hypothetical protein
MDMFSIIFDIILLIAIILEILKQKFRPEKFDERQQKVRGEGYRYALITSDVVLLVLFLIHDDIFSKLPLFYFVLIPVYLSTTVFMFYTTINHAYYGYNQPQHKLKTYLILAILVIILAFIQGEGIGYFLFYCYLFAGIFLLIPAIGILIDRHEEKEDD